MQIKPYHVGQLLGAIVISYLGIELIQGNENIFFVLLSNLNLGFHEAGHFLFFPFQALSHGADWGRTIYVLGGSLLQWGIPLFFVCYFLVRRQSFSVAMLFFWLGQSIHDSVDYIADAADLALPLWGGEGVIHDWNYLLFEFGVLHRTQEIADMFWTASVGMIFLSMVLCWATLINDVLLNRVPRKKNTVVF